VSRQAPIAQGVHDPTVLINLFSVIVLESATFELVLPQAKRRVATHQLIRFQNLANLVSEIELTVDRVVELTASNITRVDRIRHRLSRETFVQVSASFQPNVLTITSHDDSRPLAALVCFNICIVPLSIALDKRDVNDLGKMRLELLFGLYCLHFHVECWHTRHVDSRTSLFRWDPCVFVL